jgi:hypothetical protein
MTGNVMVSDPDPRKGRETLATGDKSTLPIVGSTFEGVVKGED